MPVRRVYYAIIVLCICAGAGAWFACKSGPDEMAPDGGVGAGNPGAPGAGSPGDPGGDPGSTDSDAGDASGRPVSGTLHAFVGSRDGNVRTYLVDASTGAWSLRATSSIGGEPSFLAFDMSRRRVLAVNEASAAAQGGVRSLAFDSDAGTLRVLDTKTTGGATATHVSLDASGRWVFVANFTGGNAAVLALAEDGGLGAANVIASGNKSHWFGTSPTGAFAFVPTLGADRIAQYTFNASTGAIAANASAATVLPAGTGPRHLAFAPNGRAYLINETACAVVALTLNASGGFDAPGALVSALPPGVRAADGGAGGAAATGAEIAAHPTLPVLYASTRSYDSIAVFTLDAQGTPTRVQNALTGAHEPRSFAVDPRGQFLFAGNETAGEVVGFRIGGDGQLTSMGRAVSVPTPAFVGLVLVP